MGFNPIQAENIIQTTMMAGNLADENARLRAENSELKARLEQSEDVRAKQKELLRDWMKSQATFKSLFKKYGVVNGKSVDDTPRDEITKVVVEAETEVIRQMKP